MSKNKKTNGALNLDALKETDEELGLPEIDDEDNGETKGLIKLVGEVTGCQNLNIRSKPNAKAGVVSTLRAGSEVIINEEESTATFYKVCTSAGIEGYCMCQYITVR